MGLVLYIHKQEIKQKLQYVRPLLFISTNINSRLLLPIQIFIILKMYVLCNFFQYSVRYGIF